MNRAKPRWLFYITLPSLGIVVMIAAIFFYNVFIDTPNRPSQSTLAGEHQKAPVNEKGSNGATLNLNHQPIQLFGMKIGDKKQQFLLKYGDSNDEYFTDGDSESLFVLEYPDFSVGFNAEDQAEFIAVLSDSADPGLAGLRIGSPAELVLSTLGPPDNASSYVLTYERNESTLKFDIDIELRTVISIKLFKTP